MGTTSEKLTYLNTTKTLIKEELNLGGANITTEPFRQYKAKLEGIYKDFLANGTDTLWNNWEKVSGTGETLSLTPTIKGRIQSDLKGNTYQYSTTGKNKLNNEGTFRNGYINASGTFVSENQSFVYDDYIKVNANTNYCYSANKSIRNFAIMYYDTSKTFISKQQFNNVSTCTPTIPQNCEYILLGGSYNSTDTITSQLLNTLELQFETGNSRTSYEPYTGSIPAPNPDFPEPIQVVSGDNSIKVEGKNLFDKDSAEQTSYYIDPANGSHVARTGSYIYKMEVLPNTSYTRNNIKNSSNITFFSSISYWDSNNNFISGSWNANQVITTPNNSNVKYMILSTSNDMTQYSDTQTYLNNFMIEKGNQATPYTPYVSQTYPISLGAIELCKIGTYQDYIRKSTGKNLCNGINQNYFITPEALAGIYQNNSGLIIEVDGTSKYTISTTINQYRYRVGCTDTIPQTATANVQVYGYTDKGGTSDSITLDTTGHNYILVNATDLGAIQVEKGNQSTSFEPYTNGVPTWYLHKEIGKVVLDGSENWSLSSASPQRFIYNFGDGYSDAAKLLILSNYFKGIKFDDRDNVNYPSIYLENGYIGCNKTGIDTVVNFTTWLSNNNTTVYYVLATPTNTEITDSTLLTQLNNLYNANSYEGTTNVSQVNDDMPFILDITALKEMAATASLTSLSMSRALPVSSDEPLTESNEEEAEVNTEPIEENEENTIEEEVNER